MSPSQEGAQAVQVFSPRQVVLVPRQAVLVPQLGKSAGSASTLSEAESTNPQASNSAGNTNIHSQTGNTNPLPHILGRRTGIAGTPPQADWSLSPSQGASGGTVGDATSSLDNTTGITGEQGQRTGG